MGFKFWPISLNRYIYVNNNCLKFKDTKGRAASSNDNSDITNPTSPTPWINEGFSDPNDYYNTITDWENKDPGFPGLYDAYQGNKIGKKITKQWAKKTKNDKWLHCYVGCEIAHQVNPETAKYAAWWKEKKDLTDGCSNTHFDKSDYDATEFGSNITGDCQKECENKYGKP